MSWQWRPYVSVAQRRMIAMRRVKQMEKKGKSVHPVKIEGRTIAKTFWGKSWCDNLESYSDFSNRLPRGRTYVRNGSVFHVDIAKGKVSGMVSGSEIYQVKIDIKPTDKKSWNRIKRECAGSIDSIMDLLQGQFAQSVMTKLTRQDGGLFPSPREIRFRCDCPDWAYMCKHVAAVLYGIGARLDDDPELLFVLRGVDHLELIDQASDACKLEKTLGGATSTALDGADLENVFGIELDTTDDSDSVSPRKPKRARRNTERQGKTAPRARGQGLKRTTTRKKANKKHAATTGHDGRAKGKESSASTTSTAKKVVAKKKSAVKKATVTTKKKTAAKKSLGTHRGTKVTTKKKTRVKENSRRKKAGAVV